MVAHAPTLFSQKAIHAVPDSLVVTMPFRQEMKASSVNNIDVLNVPSLLRDDHLSSYGGIIGSYGAGMLWQGNILGFGDALILVDGLPRSADGLLPEEIESITILKDVNAQVLYGSQAKNGVVIVKTKRGSNKPRQINFTFESGFNQMFNKPRYLNSVDYMTLYNEAQWNDDPSRTPDYDPDMISMYDGHNPLYPNVDYYGSDYLKNVSNATRLVGEFSGGNDVAHYYANVGWLYNASPLKSDEYNFSSNQFRVRTNVDFSISKTLKTYLNAAFVFDMNREPRTYYYTMASTFHPHDYTPLLPVDQLEDPSLAEGLNLVDGRYLLGGTGSAWKSSFGKNVYGVLNREGYLHRSKRTMQFNVGVEYDLSSLVEGLKLNGEILFDTYGGYGDAIENTYAVYEPTFKPGFDKITAIKTIGKDSKTGVLSLFSGELARSANTNIWLNYDRTFDKTHRLGATLLAYYSYASVPGTLYATKHAHLGLNVNYGFRDTYLVDFSGAYIHSVKLAPGNRGAFSPSLGLGWVVSNEPFWNRDLMIDYLKVRASAGILYTDVSEKFGYNLFKEIYTGAFWFATGDEGGYGSQGYTFDHTANHNLKMEQMKNVNIGAEIGLLDKSLYVEANYFYTNYAGQIVKRQSAYPAFMSRLIPYENYNETTYNGLDLSLSYSKQFGDFRLTSRMNWLYTYSKVRRLDEFYENDYQYRQGKSADLIWGLKNLGFFRTDEEALASNQSFGTIRRGDLQYVDADQDGKVEYDDYVPIGNWNPRWSGALNITAGWKDFSLHVAASTHLKYNWVMSGDYFWVNGNKKYSEMVWGRWTDQTAETATYPRLTAQSGENNFQYSDFWIRNGNEFSIDRIQLNYDLPKSLLVGTFVKSLRVYGRANNILYLSEDARLRRTYTQPITRNYSLGLNVEF